MDIRKIFETNKELIGAVDRAVCFFRTGRYDKALEWVADTADEIHLVTDAVMTDIPLETEATNAPSVVARGIRN